MFQALEPFSGSCDRPLVLIAAHVPLSANVLLSSFSQEVHVFPDDPGPTPARLKALVDVVEDELSREEDLLDRQGVLQRLAELIVITLVRHMVAASERIRSVLPAALLDPRIWRALASFQRAPASMWTVDRLAKVAGMSRTAFAVRFRELMGIPPLQSLTHIRLNLAADMLLRDDAPVKRIAESVGYSTEAAFCRAFARDYGVSPGRWRQKKRFHRVRTPSR